MKHFLPYRQALLLAIATMIGSPNLTAETVEVKTPGTLRLLMYELDSPNISSLTITGVLNSSDLKYIADGKGDIANIKNLDLSDITLISGGDAYASTTYNLPNGESTVYFYVSDKDEYTSSQKTWGYNDNYRITLTENYYGNQLAGLFINNTNLETVKLPSYIQCIAPYIFLNCSKLKNIDFPTSVMEISKSAFADSHIESLVLSDGVRTIAPSAFRNSDIKDIVLPSTLDSIGTKAFQNSKISTIDLSQVKKIGPFAFSNSAIEGKIDLSGINYIPENLFEQTRIAEITLSDELRTIEGNAFLNCHNLHSVSIPPSLENIGKNAFAGTPWLTNYNDEDGVVYINSIAYMYRNETTPQTLEIKDGTTRISPNFIAIPNDNIREIILPPSLISIGDEAFKSLTSLKRIDWHDNIEAIGHRAFEECYNLGFKNLPAKLKTIGRYAFSNCKNIFSLTLPESLARLGDYAFEGCDGITNCVLHSSNLSANPEAFGTNNNLNHSIGEVTVGSNVKRVPDQLFVMCDAVNTVIFEDRNPGNTLELGSHCFGWGRNSRIVINYPKGCVTYVGIAVFSDAIFQNEISFEGLRGADYSAFNGCIGFPPHLVIPESVVGGIWDTALFNIPNIETIELRAPSINAGWLATSPLYDTNNPIANYGVKKVIIGKDVQVLNSYIFYLCINLREIEFEDRDPDNYVPLEIGTSFYGGEKDGTHSQICDITFPYGTTKCAQDAFPSWISKISFPPTFEEFTFSDEFSYIPPCYSELKEIYCYAPIPPQNFDKVKLRESYKDYISVDVHVPMESVRAYKNDSAWGRCNIIGIPTISEKTALEKNDDCITNIYTLSGVEEPGTNFDNLPQGIYIVKYASGKIDKIIK
ncbi:MAG: leucine-rich repeat domain-containing protein [Muribaculaceae bacterium]